MENKEVTLFWFRRDLRLYDNAGLYHALKQNKNVLPLFIFDSEILEKLSDKKDKRVEFIYNAIENLHRDLAKLNSSILVEYGKPIEVFKKLMITYSIKAVYTNHDYEPYAIKRDKQIYELLNTNSVDFYSFKDQVIFEKNEVLKDDGAPYTIFSPYMRKWKAAIKNFYLKAYPTEKYFENFYKTKPQKMPSIAEIGFEKNGVLFSSTRINPAQISKYKENRDFPFIDGTSKLSVHLRFGTVSIRELASRATELNETWLNELIWREFYMMILYHFPYVTESCFKPQYNGIEWRNNEKEFDDWCNGKTGYPIVDAGMRELNETGFMHNRVRMIVASFLTKHLLIDWRWGEAYFAEKLLDFDLSANNGGWQWAAGCGCDAAPYFRIFNPYEQTKKFDSKFEYIKKWVPEFEDFTQYPQPIVDHKMARERVLITYKKALN
ncbi:MAG: deoxyribodipyrimidine photo-lyase [Bacteroidota bacterium]